jgi:hypothetical protein
MTSGFSGSRPPSEHGGSNHSGWNSPVAGAASLSPASTAYPEPGSQHGSSMYPYRYYHGSSGAPNGDGQAQMGFDGSRRLPGVGEYGLGGQVGVSGSV